MKKLPTQSSGSIDWVAIYQAVQESNCPSLKKFYAQHSAKFLRARISLWEFYKGIRRAKSMLEGDAATSNPEQGEKPELPAANS